MSNERRETGRMGLGRRLRAPSGDRGDRATPASALVVGGGQVGRLVAQRLTTAWTVHHVDTDATALTDPVGYETSLATDLTDRETLAAAGADDAATAVVLATPDGQALLVTQHLRLGFDLSPISVVVTDPRTADAFDLPGVEVVSAAETVSAAVVDAVGTGTDEPAVTDTTDGSVVTDPADGPVGVDEPERVDAAETALDHPAEGPETPDEAAGATTDGDGDGRRGRPG